MKRIIIHLFALLCLMCSCSGVAYNPGAPEIDNISAEPDVYSATVSFHVSGNLSSVSETGIVFGENEIENATSSTEVKGANDPSRHDYIIIQIQNLKASTRYYYQVFIGNGRSRISSDILTFTTREAGSISPGPDPSSWLELPNPLFLAVLVTKYDTNRNGGLDPDEVNAITEIDVSDEGLTDISGIELFPDLRKLICSGNLIEELDISACPVLSYLDCNPMDNFAHQNVLKTLYIRRNQPIEYIDKPDNTVIRIKE